MRRVLATELRSQFSKALGKNLPQFQPVAGKTGVFCWQIAPKLCGYVSLVLAPRTDDDFTVEIAWSCKCRFPAGAINTSPYEKPKQGKARNEMRFRLGNFWSRQDYWWQLAKKLTPMEMADSVIRGEGLGLESPDRVLDRIPAKVADAIALIKKHAIPYFEELAEDRG